MKLGITRSTGRWPARSPKAKELVPIRAATKPLGLVVGNGVVVRSTPLVTEISRHTKPGVGVTGTSTCNRVCHLVEENLVHIVVVGYFGKVPGDSDSPLGVVAGAKTSFGVVKRKTPRLI